MSLRFMLRQHLREYIEDLEDELRWDNTFGRTQAQLIEAAQRARAEIARAQVRPLDVDDL